MALSTIKDYERELLVAGYVRNIGNTYKIKNIPLDINDIIYLYQRLCDEWSEKYSSANATIDSSGSMITINSNDYVTAFGTNVVSGGVFIWRIKMISFTHNKDIGGPPFVGITEDDEGNLKTCQNSCKFDGRGYMYFGKWGATTGWTKRERDLDIKWMNQGDI